MCFVIYCVMLKVKRIRLQRYLINIRIVSIMWKFDRFKLNILVTFFIHERRSCFVCVVDVFN